MTIWQLEGLSLIFGSNLGSSSWRLFSGVEGPLFDRKWSDNWCKKLKGKFVGFVDNSLKSDREVSGQNSNEQRRGSVGFVSEQFSENRLSGKISCFYQPNRNGKGQGNSYFVGLQEIGLNHLLTIIRVQQRCLVQ